MHLVLYLLAAVTAAAGIMLIGFGIPINEFSLGNTLIIAGTTALTGAVIVLCLAAVNRNLRRIADLLGARPTVPARAAEAPEPAISPVRAAPPRPRESAQAEEPGYDQPRFRPSTSLPGGDPAFDHQGHEPAPRTPPRAPAPGLAPEPPADRRGWRPPGARTSPPAPEDNSRTPPRSAPSPRANPEANFDSIWPTESQPDTSPRPPRADTGPAPGPNGGGYPDLPPKTRPDTTPISVLKSGVVDGMAYTLYTDGSIEAELAQGVVRFGSIEELRNHLEKGS